MVLTVDQQVEVLALVVSLEALEAPHFLLLVCNGVRRDAAAVMPAISAKEGLSWTSVTSLLRIFPKATRLRFSKQPEEELITVCFSRVVPKEKLVISWCVLDIHKTKRGQRPNSPKRKSQQSVLGPLWCNVVRATVAAECLK